MEGREMDAAPEFKVEVWQGGKIVAVASGPDPVTAERNATHLAIGYAANMPGDVFTRPLAPISRTSSP